MNKKHIITLVTIVVCLIGTIAMAGGIKERMIQRKPVIDTLLAQGVIGENNQGFLEFRAAQQQADVVNAENADRTTVYNAISKKTGASPAIVGQRRAAQIAQQAQAGEWLQDASGQWYQK